MVLRRYVLFCVLYPKRPSHQKYQFRNPRIDSMLIDHLLFGVLLRAFFVTIQPIGLQLLCENNVASCILNPVITGFHRCHHLICEPQPDWKSPHWEMK
ncbi:hypothetical protein I7I50_01054 [Histoplasma capsulatum G186AR]|uniref:Uncharacterized protein n=1 Tax=Ajellomyces capsulatus TaxID=5037 RepID=A0A8H7YH87_AJECA|nr:hypothetical protein I7I52_08320 [Histoplasma capsulatum]QSS73029.1 hypothetical protein I7I50_01054 [Histoplasma capsulatum G186AR]